MIPRIPKACEIHANEPSEPSSSNSPTADTNSTNLSILSGGTCITGWTAVPGKPEL